MDLKSRRKILQTGVAAALFSASGLSMAAQARAQGGRLRIGVSDGGSRDGWDFSSGTSTFMALAGQGAVFDTLTEVSADGSLRGELAVSWAPTMDATQWTLTLRDAVTFHDGTPFTAADVVASFDHYARTQSPSPSTQTIAQITILDPLVVRFDLHGANPDFPWLLSDPALVIQSARYLSMGRAGEVGTGLYRVCEFRPGVRLLARRVPGHYKDGRAGWFDEVELLALPDERQRIAALQSGRVDVIHDLLPAGIAQFQADQRFDVKHIPQTHYIAFDCTGPEGPELRNALSRVIDRQSLVAAALGHTGSPAHDVPIPGFEPDPRAAGEHSKLPETLAVALDEGLGGAGARVVSALSRQLRRAGVHVTLASSGQASCVVARRASVRPVDDWTWLDWMQPQDGLRPQLAAARASLDPALRVRRYEELARLAASRSHVLVPCFIGSTIVHRRNLEFAGKPGRAFDLDGGRIAERWWRA
jgi:peptide/nickel transport system substrate-binding protein